MTTPDRLTTHRNPIETATSFETAIEIISEEECLRAIEAMKVEFRERFPDPSQISLIPILKGGVVIGDILAEAASGELNPMRMSYYDESLRRLPKPICLQSPDIRRIVVDGQTRPVVFTEAVVDSQGTLLAAMGHINSQIDELSRQVGIPLSYPDYDTFALVSKTGDNPVAIPNLVAMFKVHPDIWIHGWGCDNAERGREETCIMGVLSSDAQETPQQPYYQALF